MSASSQTLNPCEAARQLGVSAKALRLYEERGLLFPLRSASGWRAYGPDQMARAGEIASLRALGLSLAQVARVLNGDARGLEPVLAAHQARLGAELRRISATIDKVQAIRGELARGGAPSAGDLARLSEPAGAPAIAFDLPWPWGGERFELRDLTHITYVTGPLGSGKTRLARRLAEVLPGAVFLGPERLADGAAAARARLEADPALAARVEEALSALTEDGASASDALLALLVGLEAPDSDALVVDMVEQGLDAATQEALTPYLRRRADARPLVLLTRSSTILDFDALGPGEAILYCPANHSPPMRVAPHPGAPGYEALVTCLAPPDVRARTEGTIAFRPQVA